MLCFVVVVVVIFLIILILAKLLHYSVCPPGLSLPISFTSRNSGLLPKPGSCEILSTGSYILKSLDRKVNQGAIQCLSFLNSGR